MKSQTISVMTPCYNEVDNVVAIYSAVKDAMNSTNYNYEHVFIDNASEDGTAEELRKLAEADPRVRVIINMRNFGHLRSPYHALLQCNGAAAINIAADLQDPPTLIPRFIEEWENGALVVLGQAASTTDNLFLGNARRLYYFLLKNISHVEIHKSTTGFGLYDRRALDILKTFQELYSYLRGMISEAGLPVRLIRFDKPQRTHGKTKNNFFSLYDLALTGFVNHSLLPLKIITALGISLSFFCFVISIAYFIYKLFYWEEFTVGIAPLLFGGFFISGILLMSIGIIGEYIAIIHINIRNHPLVVEKTRLNFDGSEENPEKK